ncbi:lipid-A-disaccharide synthase [Elusimicrobiota bacterium]
MSKEIFIVAGDISGDIHAANLIKAIKKVDPEAEVTALGGNKLENVSDNFLADLINISAFGFFALFRSYSYLKNIFNKEIKQRWTSRKPEKVILVDYYGFNIHVAKYAYGLNIPVYYYISPQVWASRPGRVKKLAKYVKKMFVILPFEKEIYEKAGVDTSFVGHPLLDMVPENNGVKRDFNKPIIGLFPGSRKSVYTKHIPILMKAAEIIKEKIPSAEFKIFNLDSYHGRKSKYKSVDSNDYPERMQLSLAITTSGTVSLENALLGIPMVVFYRLSWFNYLLAKIVVRVKYITMVNILAGQELIPEFIQSMATPEKIAQKAVSILNDKIYLQTMKDRLLAFRSRLGKPNVSARVANMIMDKKNDL